MRWKNKHTIRKKYLSGIAFLLAGFLLLIGWVISTYINYYSIRKKSVFSQEELKMVYDEYHLDDDVHIEYLFSSGNDLYGVRLALIGNSDSINDIFDCDIIGENENRSSTVVRYYSSSGYVNATDMTKYICKLNNLLDEHFIGMWFFEENDTWYIEISKQYTKNIELYE